MMGTIFYYSPSKIALKQAINDKIKKVPNPVPIKINIEFEIFAATLVVFYIEMNGIHSLLN